MTCYVDPLIEHGGEEITALIPFARRCHLFSASDVELQKMARQIGVDKKMFFNNKNFSHYAITVEQREKAVELGVEEVSLLWMLAFFKLGEHMGSKGARNN